MDNLKINIHLELLASSKYTDGWLKVCSDNYLNSHFGKIIIKNYEKKIADYEEKSYVQVKCFTIIKL